MLIVARLFRSCTNISTNLLLLQGDVNVAIDSDVMLFTNHGCNGTYNFGLLSSKDHDNQITEVNFHARISADLTQNMNILIKAPAYCPIYERNLRRLMVNGGAWACRALRKIKKGEEILHDYLTYSGDLDDATEYARS